MVCVEASAWHDIQAQLRMTLGLPVLWLLNGPTSPNAHALIDVRQGGLVVQ